MCCLINPGVIITSIFLNNNIKNNLKTQLLKHNYWGVNLLEPYTLFFALTATQLRDYESSTLLTSLLTSRQESVGWTLRPSIGVCRWWFVWFSWCLLEGEIIFI